MTHIVKQIDPLKVARLPEAEYEGLFRAMDLLDSRVKEVEFPAELYASAFCTMRSCGATNLRCYDGMRIVAMQLKKFQLTIRRLRAFAVPPAP